MLQQVLTYFVPEQHVLRQTSLLHYCGQRQTTTNTVVPTHISGLSLVLTCNQHTYGTGMKTNPRTETADIIVK